MPPDPGTPEGSSAGEFRFVLEDPTDTAKKQKRPEVIPIPQTEEQWQSSRVACGLDTPEHIIDKVTQLRLNPAYELQDWQRLVIVAATTVAFVNQEEDNPMLLGKAYRKPPSYNTRRKDQAAVTNLIGLFDRLYSSLEHRAFELLLIQNTSLSTIRSWTKNDFKAIQCPALTLKEEIQASAPLYIPFLVHILRPDYDLKKIQKALKTNQLTEHDLQRFLDIQKTRNFTPCLLNTLGDRRIPHCDNDFDHRNLLSAEKLFPAVVQTSIDGYKTFNISRELQIRALQAKREKKVCTHIEKPGTHLVQFDWSPAIHTPVADRAFNELVQSGILCREEIFRRKAYLRLDYGAFNFESHSLQIIIPTASPDSTRFISLSSSELSRSKFNHRIRWEINRGLLLEQGTVLSTTERIFFISILIPIPPPLE